MCVQVLGDTSWRFLSGCRSRELASYLHPQSIYNYRRFMGAGPLFYLLWGGLGNDMCSFLSHESWGCMVFDRFPVLRFEHTCDRKKLELKPDPKTIGS